MVLLCYLTADVLLKLLKLLWHVPRKAETHPAQSSGSLPMRSWLRAVLAVTGRVLLDLVST